MDGIDEVVKECRMVIDCGFVFEEEVAPTTRSLSKATQGLQGEIGQYTEEELRRKNFEGGNDDPGAERQSELLTVERSFI